MKKTLVALVMTVFAVSSVAVSHSAFADDTGSTTHKSHKKKNKKKAKKKAKKSAAAGGDAATPAQ